MKQGIMSEEEENESRGTVKVASGECVRVEKKAIRCAVCDRLMAESSDKVALEDFHDVGVVCCDEHYKMYFEEFTGLKRTHGVTYILRGHYKKGEDLSGNDMWVLLRRCRNVVIEFKEVKKE